MLNKLALYIFSLITLASNAMGITQATPSPMPTTLSTSTPVATSVGKKIVVNNDPIVNCGPGQTSKQYVKDKASNCKKYVDCGLNNNTVYTMMLKTECDKKHAEANQNNTNSYNPANGYIKATPMPSYPPCTIHWPFNNSSQTYYYLSPEQCKKAQDDANKVGTAIAPVATPFVNTKCNEAIAMANEYLANFRANKMSGYSNSAEAMVAYIAERQELQNLINSYGCTHTLQ